MKKIILLVLILSNTLYSCTIFNVKDYDHSPLVGRNFDWSKDGGYINFIPSTNYSNGVVTLTQIDTNMPYEGMNDKGLFVGISAVSSTSTPLNIFKPIRKSLEMVKIILQKADNIDSAIKIFSKYTVIFGEFLGNPLVHFKIVDKSGHSAVVEFVNGERRVVKDTPIMTNHYISEKNFKANNESSFRRFNTLSNYLSKQKTYSLEDVFKLLKDVSQRNTIWSNVYDLKNQIIYIKYKDRAIVSFNLKDQLYKYNKPYFYDMKTIYQDRKVSFLKDKNSSITVRSHFGFGNSGSSHYGARILLNAGDDKKYGLEFSKFKTNSDEFSTIGIVIEQRLWKWFNMSIGTIGYLDYKQDGQNVMGLTSNLGWEPDNHISFRPFVSYRSDLVFAKNSTDIFHSISIGFNLEF